MYVYIYVHVHGHGRAHTCKQTYILTWCWLIVGDEVAVNGHNGHSDTKRSDLWTILRLIDAVDSVHRWGSIVLNSEIKTVDGVIQQHMCKTCDDALLIKQLYV